MGERDTQKLILDWLAAKHITAFRMQTGVTIRSYKGKTRKVGFGVVGMADILAFPHRLKGSVPGLQGTAMRPMPTWIEVKAPKGVQSALQRSFQEKMESEGHCYILARDLSDVEKVLG